MRKLLSPQEVRAGKFFLFGFKSKDIAVKMQINEKTVCTYLTRCRKKLGVNLQFNSYFLGLALTDHFKGNTYSLDYFYPKNKE